MLAALAACVSGCVAVPDRPATSTAGCAQAVLDRHLPHGLKDKQAHCVAGGLIARFCSPAEARLAGLAKELRDIFDAGDADWSDWQATRAGVRCAAPDTDAAAIAACCKTALNAPGAGPAQ